MSAREVLVECVRPSAAPAHLQVVAIDDSRAHAWNEYAQRSDGASIYHLYEWRQLIADVFGHDGKYFAACDEAGRVRGILPIIRLRSLLFGDYMVSMPYFNYGGVVADSEEATSMLLEHATAYARTSGVSHLELRQVSPVADWPTRVDKITMRRRLPPSPDSLSKQLGSKLRSQIKRPVREGAVAVSGGIELLSDFYAVFSRNMRDLGTPVYGRAFFKAILTRFAERAKVFVVRLAGRPVAAGLTLAYRQQLEIPWASSLREMNSIGVNMLLYWSILEYACSNGFDTFDFGRSTVDSGTYRFKRQWGAEPHQLHWHYWLKAGGEPPVMNPSNSKYRLAVAAWQRLPLAVANWVGPHLVKNLP